MIERKEPEQPIIRDSGKVDRPGGESEEGKRTSAESWNVPDSVRVEHLARAARQAEERAAQGREHVENAQRLGALQQQFGIKDPDQMREEVIQKTLADGGARMYTSVNSDLSQRNSAGYQSIEDSRINDGRAQAGIAQIIADVASQMQVRDQTEIYATLDAHDLHEIIDIRTDKKPVFENVIVPGRKGMFGIGGTSDQVEKRRTGRTESIKHRDVVKGGKDEPAVRISYFAGAKNSEWRDYSGRKGQLLIFEMVVPESIAKEIEREIEKDPAIMRNIAERFAKEKVLRDPSAWETPQGQGDPLRPPYEKWDAKTGGKMYLQKESGTPGWHEESVRKIKQK